MTDTEIKIGVAWFSGRVARDFFDPLFEEVGGVDVLQWTLDSLAFKALPKEDLQVLERYAVRGALSGHGVHYSVLSVSGEALRKEWIDCLRNDPFLKKYNGVSVHFGFSVGWDLKQAAPMPVACFPETIEIGRRNLGALADLLPCPLGLENLALAFSRQDVEEQGHFLERLLEPFDGYVLLDLHNIYCQAINFDVDFMDLVRSYPLARVREIHISGGSWSAGKEKRIRRDTHDDKVPDALYTFLPEVIKLCPQLKFVFLEQLPSALRSQEQQDQYKSDFLALRNLIHV